MKKIIFPDRWRKASFTVEAAVIIPLTLTVIALLIGYCLYEHQNCWCRGAAYEAVLKGLDQSGSGSGTEKAGVRMSDRLEEMPVTAGEAGSEVSEGFRLCVSWCGNVLPGVFPEQFTFSGQASLVKMDPVLARRIGFLVKWYREH